jgi:hypothetical protein
MMASRADIESRAMRPSTGARVLAEDGLWILAHIRSEFGLMLVTEAVDLESLDLVERYGDVIQIGAHRSSPDTPTCSRGIRLDSISRQARNGASEPSGRYATPLRFW